jgi:hypothetical protein
MTRIGVGGLINLEKVHQAHLLLNDIKLFHEHADRIAPADYELANETAPETL